MDTYEGCIVTVVTTLKTISVPDESMIIDVLSHHPLGHPRISVRSVRVELKVNFAQGTARSPKVRLLLQVSVQSERTRHGVK